MNSIESHKITIHQFQSELIYKFTFETKNLINIIFFQHI